MTSQPQLSRAKRVPHILARLLLALLPLLATPVFGHLLAEGLLNLGGGDKDILMVIPWLAWSILHLGYSILFWIRRTPLWRSALLSGLLGLFTLLAVALIMSVVAPALLGVPSLFS